MRTASRVRLKRALISLSALLGVSFPAFAQFTRWPPGSGDTDYSIAADGAETFLNTPALHGSIHVSAGNNFTGGELNGYLANFSLGNFSGGPPDTSAVRGSTAGVFPVVGVYGTSTAPDHGVGMQGVASGASSTGVFGQGDFAGLQGFTTAANGFGTSGVASGAGSHAICNGACATPGDGGLAGNFTGDVVIRGPTGLTLSTGDGYKPGGGMWMASSDARVKKDVKRFELGLAALERVRPVRFKYNGLGGTGDDGHEYVGVIAQELEKISPPMVSSKKTKLNEGDAQEAEIKQVDPSAFTYMLINAVQEQQKIIQRQDARIAALERGRAPLISSLLSDGLGVGAALGLAGLGLFAAIRRQQKRGS